MEALYSNSYGKIKNRKKGPSYVKKMKKAGPKKKQILFVAPFCQGKKEVLAESGKGSWFGQNAFDNLSIFWRYGAFA